MKLILSALLVLVQLTAFGAASVPYEQLNPHHFDWAVFPEVALKGMSRAGDLPGDIISLVGGTNYWKLVGNDLSPTVGTSVSTTNLFAYTTLNAAGALILTGTLTTNMVAGTNDVSSLGYDVIRVTGFNASTNGSYLRLYAPGNGLGTILVVQNYSAGSGFTMASDSECAGGDPTMIMRLNGDWTPNRQGESIMLYNYGQGWAEIGRTPTQSITYSTAIFTNIFTTSFILGGTYITNVLQHPNPTIGYIPYNADGTNFLDSPFYRLTTNSIGFYTTNQFIWQPSSQTLAIGYKALASRDALSGVVAIGPTAMEIASGPLQSVAVGYAALRQSQAADNVAVGHRAMEVAVGANNSTALGYLTLNKVTSGFDNIAVGASALRDITTGSKNVAIGSQSLLVSSADSDTAVGYFSGLQNSSGGFNSFLGYQSGSRATTSGNNTAIGYNSLGDRAGAGVMTGQYNTAVGAFSAPEVTTGEENTIIGFQAGNIITTGSRNTALGSGALGTALGSDNVAIGRGSLILNGGGSNTFVGTFSGGKVATPGDAAYNTGLGYGAGPVTGSGAITNSIAIGFNVGVTNTDEIVIGNSANTKVIFPIPSYTGTGANFLSDDGTYKTPGGGPGGDTLWYAYTAVDVDGGPVYGTASTNSFLINQIDFATSYITNFSGDFSTTVSIGYANMPAVTIATNYNEDIWYMGNFNFSGSASVSNNYVIGVFGEHSFKNSDVTNNATVFVNGDFNFTDSKIYNNNYAFIYGNNNFSSLNEFDGSAGFTNNQIMIAYGDHAGWGGRFRNNSKTTLIGADPAKNAAFIGNKDMLVLGGGAQSSSFTNCDNVAFLMRGAGSSIPGTFTNILFIGNGATTSITNDHDKVILGPTMSLVVPGSGASTFQQIITTNGYGSFATNSGAITSTGWTNSLSVDADVAFDATTLIYKLADYSGAFWYTNTIAIGQGFIHLQPGGQFVLVSGTGLTGQYHAH